MKNFSLEKKLFYIFRIAIAMCFIGHGIFGIITKQIWCNYFGVFGISEPAAYRFMPLIGTFDILMGTIMLFYPVRIIPAWLVFWGVFTALLRPLSSEPFAEFIERAGNFGIPLAMLLLYGRSNDIKGWFKKMDPDIKADPDTLNKVAIWLRFTVFLLIAGHGWLNIIQKPGLINQYSNLGFSNPHLTAQIIGTFELLAGLSVLFKPIRPLLIMLFFWKAGSEIFYPQWAAFEWIERGGSYGAILALWYMSEKEYVKSSLFNLYRKVAV